jgi:hypothetical protein
MTTDPECNKNVFQLWKEGDEKLPFKVVRWTWNPSRQLCERSASRAVNRWKSAVSFSTRRRCSATPRVVLAQVETGIVRMV